MKEGWRLSLLLTLPAILAQDPDKSYCISVWRNFGHFEWLDQAMRADKDLKAALKSITLPSEARPRTWAAPSTWFGPKHQDKEDRMPHLVSYLRALLASEACANSLYLKIFLSPDELFRPIRAAVKHSLITPVAQIVAEALPAVAGQASGDLRATLYQREQCDGPRLVIEHTEYEEIVPWLQLQCDKSMHAMLSEQVSDGTARVATLAGRCAEVVKQMRDDHQEHAEGPVRPPRITRSAWRSSRHSQGMWFNVDPPTAQ